MRGENMDNVLVKEEKYSGRYVAMKDFNDFTIVADGKDPKETMENALKRGIAEPVILYVPIKGMVQIY
jgi:hypothetical protein